MESRRGQNSGARRPDWSGGARWARGPAYLWGWSPSRFTAQSLPVPGLSLAPRRTWATRLVTLRDSCTSLTGARPRIRLDHSPVLVRLTPPHSPSPTCIFPNPSISEFEPSLGADKLVPFSSSFSSVPPHSSTRESGTPESSKAGGGGAHQPRGPGPGAEPALRRPGPLGPQEAPLAVHNRPWGCLHSVCGCGLKRNSHPS